MRKTIEIFGKIDGITILLYLFLVFFGWVNIYASMYNDDITTSVFDLSTKYGKQLLFIGISLFAAFVILIIDWRFFDTLSFVLYGITIISLIAVLFFAKETGGANSWFKIGNFKIQPSEFAKFTTSLALAKMFSLNKQNLFSFRSMIRNYTIILIPFFLIILQNDMGTALVFTSFILVFYREGLSGNVLIVLLVLFALVLFSLLIYPWIVAVFFTSLIFIIYYFSSNRVRSLKVSSIVAIISNGIIFSTGYLYNHLLSPHQIERINILIGKDFDPQNAGYNLIQSKIAIGSGGFFGKGFLHGTQTRFDFVPEQSTDFIFCTIGEEWGFLGSFIFLLVFTTLLLRIIFLAEKQKSQFCRVYGYSVACILFIHLIINISMTIGLAPIIGIPLPFMSYGGSSLVSFTILIFIFLNLNSYRMDILR
ncbi:MAG: rod shape-determining protein RodA [Flavobacteriales bacterium]|jgi:rod shape determining protein RodA|nr:rod shape-determining protein RodA [Flavobacteriales bacterium]MBT4477995.1 rod shape-determining protein RodA [Flavobacteriales bacterium]MBT5354292.1 rod shape-determining protein RodA [Flavobacteriales bacterium]MBT5699020.1 rod shape-determining protein RodA [Flavobacteriales bacterium]MBT6698978.1 rod shape-determining protein RodA [Flavobacteriales bacterium]